MTALPYSKPVMACLLRVRPKALTTASRPSMTWHVAAYLTPFSTVLSCSLYFHTGPLTVLGPTKDMPRSESLYLFFPLPGEFFAKSLLILSPHFLKAAGQILLYACRVIPLPGNPLSSLPRLF